MIPCARRLSTSFRRRNSNSENTAPTTPATPGTFHYLTPNIFRNENQIQEDSSSEEENPFTKRQGKNVKTENSWWSNISWLGSIATLLMVIGGLMFTINLKLVSDMYLVLLEDAMHISWKWLETGKQEVCQVSNDSISISASIIITVMGALMITLALLIFISTMHLPCSS